MNNFIKLASTTEAMRAKNILFKYGIRSQIKRIYGKSSGNGCSFGIVVFGDIEKAIDVLINNGININGRAYGDDI